MFQEHRAGDRRHHRRDQAAAGRRQATGKQVRHIAGSGDRLGHLPERFGRDLIGRVQRTRGGDRRDAGELGHVVQRDGRRFRAASDAGGSTGLFMPHSIEVFDSALPSGPPRATFDRHSEALVAM